MPKGTLYWAQNVWKLTSSHALHRTTHNALYSIMGSPVEILLFTDMFLVALLYILLNPTSSSPQLLENCGQGKREIKASSENLARNARRNYDCASYSSTACWEPFLPHGHIQDKEILVFWRCSDPLFKTSLRGREVLKGTTWIYLSFSSLRIITLCLDYYLKSSSQIESLTFFNLTLINGCLSFLTIKQLNS